MFTLKDTVEISVPVGSKQRLNNLSCSTEKKPLKKGELKLFYSDNLSSNKFPDSWKEGVSTLVHFFFAFIRCRDFLPSMFDFQFHPIILIHQ